VPRPHPQIHTLPLDDGLVLYDERNGRGHVLNHTAAQVWGLLDRTRTASAVAEVLANTYGVPHPQIVADVHDLVDELHQAGLVIGS
jgi:PqqD family protein of HPr-rel-A system